MPPWMIDQMKRERERMEREYREQPRVWAPEPPPREKPAAEIQRRGVVTIVC